MAQSSAAYNRNEYGVINASGNAHMILGNVYEQPPALTSEQRCLQTFKTSSYENHKDRNPPRVADTCKWVLDHPHFHNWRSSKQSTLLWVSADPGCGKSVLSKALVDENLCSNDSNTVLYFFFKDNEEQDNLATALCAILHQLFCRHPELIRHAIPAWEQNSDELRGEAQEMWRILQASITDHAGPVICVLDALDECKDQDRRKLIEILCDLQQTSQNNSSAGILKVLVTSRPYDNVQRWFEKTTSKWPYIRLRGEHENDQIHQEINLVIGQHVQDLTREFSLPTDVHEKLQRQLLNMQHRTYLWLYLAMEEVRELCRDSIFVDSIQVVSLPTSVEDAYERILCKIKERQKLLASRVLLIIVGTRRPLSIEEIAFALGAAQASQQNSSTLTQIEPKRLLEQIREQCGLFLFINHSQLFLIHQTAKEFLLRKNSDPRPNSLKWKSCLSEIQIECEMTNICVTYLLSFRTASFDRKTRLQQTVKALPITAYMRTQHHVSDGFEAFWQYCAEHWTDHLRDEFIKESSTLLNKVLCLFDTHRDVFHMWFPIRWQVIYPYQEIPRLSSLHAVAITGHSFAFQKILDGMNDVTTVNARDSSGKTALLYAAEWGHDQVVQLLLDRGADVNLTNYKNKTALHFAAIGSYEQVVYLLLDRGADVNSTDDIDRTALHYTAIRGYEQVVQLLLDRGADIDLTDRTIRTALHYAATNSHEQVVQLLLDRGAGVNLTNYESKTALHYAAIGGYEQVVQLLLDRGADVDLTDSNSTTALHYAAINSHEQVVQLLLDRGADVNITDYEGITALHYAVKGGYEQVVQLLLDRGADIDSTESDGTTALHYAAEGGHERVIRVLLDRGADVDLTNSNGTTALHYAAINGHERVIQLLLDRGADIDSIDSDGTAALHYAAEGGYERVVQLLLDRGANVDATERDGTMALHYAAEGGHERVVQLLRDRMSSPSRK